VAVKIVRQPNKIALLGSPTSAAAMSSGHEGAPAALRAAGLPDRLRSIGYEIADLGDDPPQVFKIDDESPRARNISGVLASLESLKPRVEQAVKSSALPLILTGDCSVVLATVAGLRRYFRHVSLIYMDRDPALNTPATTATGCLDGMVISHITGRGAAELVRFWGEPPLVREPDIALFGVDRIERAEEDVLRSAPLRCYLADEIKRIGPVAAAQAAIERIHGKGYECVVHFDVDVIADFEATDYPGTGGLNLEEVREALQVFARQKHLAALEVAAYNPLKDPDGSGAKLIIDLLADVLGKRLEALQASAPTGGVASPVAANQERVTYPSGEKVGSPEQVGGNKSRSAAESQLPSTVSGDAWSSEGPATPPESENTGDERSGRQSEDPEDAGESGA
jgi:arginase